MTSLDRLSRETGLTIREIRTAINKLKSTNEVTSHSTSSFTHIQVINWEMYQSTKTNQSTNERQTKDKPTTTTKEVKNIRTEEIDTEIGVSIETTPKEETEYFFQTLPENIDSVVVSINPEPQNHNTIKTELQKFYNYWTEKNSS